MSGEIVLSKPGEPDRYWLVATWLYKEVIRNILSHNTRFNPTLIESMEYAIAPISSRSLNLSGLSEEELQEFRATARAAYDAELKKGGDGWDNKEFWPLYIREFFNLLKVIEEDPRIPKSPDK